jgi:hypothetical protein
MFVGYRHRSRLTGLIENWIRYREIVGTRSGAEDVTPDEEHRFLRLKGRIAESLAGLGRGYSIQGPQQDIHNQIRGMTDFLGRRTSLAAGERLTDREREDFEREWHRFFLFLSRVKGLTPEPAKKPAPSPVRPVAAPPPPRASLAGLGWFVRFALRLALIVAAVWVLAAIIPWERVTGGRLRGAVPDSWSSARETVSGFRFPTLGGIFDPVVARYGPEVTSIMVAVLLVAIGYWIFVRMK